MKTVTCDTCGITRAAGSAITEWIRITYADITTDHCRPSCAERRLAKINEP